MKLHRNLHRIPFHLPTTRPERGCGRAYIDPSNNTWIGGYTLYGARVGYRFQALGGTMELLLSGRNLTSASYIAFTEPDPDGNSYQPGPGREWFAGLLVHL